MPCGCSVKCVIFTTRHSSILKRSIQRIFNIILFARSQLLYRFLPLTVCIVGQQYWGELANLEDKMLYLRYKLSHTVQHDYAAGEILVNLANCQPLSMLYISIFTLLLKYSMGACFYNFVLKRVLELSGCYYICPLIYR